MQLPATATLEQATAIVHTVRQALAAGNGPLVIDARALEVFDTSALAVLLHARRLARAAGRGFELSGAPPKLGQLAHLYGVAELLAPASASAPSASSDPRLDSAA